MAMDNQASGSLSASFVASNELAGLRTAVGKKTAELCARDYTRSLRAVVLTGSLARDEATWVREAGGWRLLGDAEFFLVLEPGARLPSRPALSRLQGEIQRTLERDQIVAHVQLAPVYTRYFTNLRPHIFAYELRACGLVVWGDASILALIPGFAPADIPLEDAWRLLANRMIEHLEAVAEAGTSAASVPEGLGYRTVKLYLDMATSLLVFAGSYAPTYRERQRRLGVLADTAGTDAGWPFPLGPFSQHVNHSTDLKLNGEWEESTELGWEVWRQGLQFARLLWRWELARLANVPQRATDGELMQSWMHRQPLADRLRGWMFVCRACGWLRSWRWWLRWTRLAAGGSPRYWVYSSAYDLFRQLPEVAKAEGRREIAPALVRELLSSLPVPRHSEVGSWPELVDEVAWNYHSFLESTRA